LDFPKRGRNRSTLLLALFTTTVLALLAQDSKTFGQTNGATLKSGDILYTDSGDAVQGGCIFKLDPQSGQRSVLSRGYLGFSGNPNGLVMDNSGQIIVANEQSLLRIDPETGQQITIRDVRGAPGAFWGVAVEHQGDLLVAAEKVILRVKPLTGQTQVLSFGGYVVLNIAIGQGDAQVYATNARYVADVGWVGEIIRVNSQTGAQTLISSASQGHESRSAENSLKGLTVSSVGP